MQVNSFFLLIKLTSQPNSNVPQMPPTHIIEPIHESSSTLSGPLERGESFDSSNKMLDDSQPVDVPYEIVKRFTVHGQFFYSYRGI